MIQKVGIENYKSIKMLTNFEMKPINILIGANNSGKSNFLDVFAFLRDTIALHTSEREKGWRAALTRRGGMESVTHKGTQQLKVDIFTQALHYKVEFDNRDRQPSLSDESLQYNEQQRIIFKFDPLKKGYSCYENAQWATFSEDWYTGLKHIIRNHTRNHEELVYQFAKSLSEIKIYDRIRTEIWSPIRSPKAAKGETVLDEDGGNLVGVLHQLSQTQSQFLERLNALLKVVFDDFVQISFPSNSQGELLLRWEDKNGRVSNVAELSDGTLKFLCLVAILRNPNPPAFIGIDEVDANLHPKMQVILADLVDEASRKTQIVTSTHNPDFVSMFKPEEIVIMQQHKNATEMRRLSNKGALDLWLEDFTIRKLWLMGELESRW